MLSVDPDEIDASAMSCFGMADNSSISTLASHQGTTYVGILGT
jgi:hypothetical protein